MAARMVCYAQRTSNRDYILWFWSWRVYISFYDGILARMCRLPLDTKVSVLALTLKSLPMTICHPSPLMSRIWALTFGPCCAIAILGLKPRVPIRGPSIDVPRKPWLPRDLSLLKSPVLFGVVGCPHTSVNIC